MDRAEADLKESARIVKLLSEHVLSHQGRIGEVEDRATAIEQKLEILIDSHIRTENQIAQVESHILRLDVNWDRINQWGGRLDQQLASLALRFEETESMLRRLIEGLGSKNGHSTH